MSKNGCGSLKENNLDNQAWSVTNYKQKLDSLEFLAKKIIDLTNA